MRRHNGPGDGPGPGQQPLGPGDQERVSTKAFSKNRRPGRPLGIQLSEVSVNMIFQGGYNDKQQDTAPLKSVLVWSLLGVASATSGQPMNPGLLLPSAFRKDLGYFPGWRCSLGTAKPRTITATTWPAPFRPLPAPPPARPSPARPATTSCRASSLGPLAMARRWSPRALWPPSMASPPPPLF